ncbi:MAG: PLP-dependent lyase/thiolase [Patescibacteria group bacterium]|nr:PLP-dependent lyase/thiolase [Patescibacteria group bacterium]MDE2172410.1 PLP-dependent lyase/thiolase [Patescibacteria group bacterium]
MVTIHEQYPKLAATLGLADIYFKREDLHPYGSHKGRSIPVMIDYYRQKSERRFAISSSGNAALAAALHVQKLNASDDARAALEDALDLQIFVGQKARPFKIDRLRALTDEHIHLTVKERPLQALMEAEHAGSRSLRQSTDDIALVGYASLAEEISRIDACGAIFMAASSGTTAQALARYFAGTAAASRVQIHIVQTSSCHPIADAFETFDGHEELSAADAIVDRTAHRKDALVPLIQKSGGHGWFASNEQIGSAQKLVRAHTGLDISPNSALSVVGAMQAAYRGWPIKGAAVCIIGGE